MLFSKRKIRQNKFYIIFYISEKKESVRTENMAKNRSNLGINMDTAKDLIYLIVLDKALSHISHKKRRKKIKNGKITQEEQENLDNLLCLKNSLDLFFLPNNKKNSEEYHIQMQKIRILDELIENIIKGKNVDIKQRIEQLMKKEGLNFVERKESPISAEEKFLIKTDFHGLSHYPSDLSLTNFFIKKRDKKRNDTNDKLLPVFDEQLYNLDKVPSWRFIKQFKSFQKRAPYFIKAMQYLNIAPHEMKRLNAYDMIYMLKLYQGKNETAPIENAKSKFIKKFIANYEPEFREYMHANKQVIEYALHLKGIQINADGENNNKSYQNFVNQIVAQMKLKGSVPPLFNIHHKRPIKDINNQQNLPLANSIENLCLIIENPYHTMLHMFDTNSYGKTIFNHQVKRVELEPNVIFFGGFEKRFQITRKKEEFNALKNENNIVIIKMRKESSCKNL